MMLIATLVAIIFLAGSPSIQAIHRGTGNMANAKETSSSTSTRALAAAKKKAPRIITFQQPLTPIPAGPGMVAVTDTDVFAADGTTVMAHVLGFCVRISPNVASLCTVNYTTLSGTSSFNFTGPFYDVSGSGTSSITGGTGEFIGATGVVTRTRIPGTSMLQVSVAISP